jgi:hypothetical protein
MKYPIEVNKVAFVKTTDEPVFVMGLDGNMAVVRRPISTQEGGVKHLVESFSIEELHTAEGKLEAEMEFTKHSLKVRDNYTEERMKETQVTPAASKETYVN